MVSISERLGVTPYPTVMRQNPRTQSPLEKLNTLNRLAQNPSQIRSSSTPSTTSRPKSTTSRPKLPTIEDTTRQNQQAIQNAINALLSSYTPRQIPTFSPDYYMPQNTLNLINRIRNQQFSPDSQLRQVAQQQVSLLTNPQIEALRSQINAYKSLIPQARQQINQNYGQAVGTIAQNTSDMIAQILAQTRTEGGLRPGVYSAITQQVDENIQPITQSLGQQRQVDIQTILGQLEAQKDSASNLLNTLQANRKNIEKTQYNALVDQARQQFNQAQQQQLNFLMQLAEIEQAARSQAANLEQERAVNYNNMLQQMLNQRMQSIDVIRRQQDETLQQQYNANMQAWMDYLYNPSVRTNADAYSLLKRNRSDIEATVGKEGFLELQDQISNLPPNQVNPNFSGSTNAMPNPRVSSTTLSPMTSFNQGIGLAFRSSPNPILRALGNLIR